MIFVIEWKVKIFLPNFIITDILKKFVYYTFNCREWFWYFTALGSVKVLWFDVSYVPFMIAQAWTCLLQLNEEVVQEVIV